MQAWRLAYDAVNQSVRVVRPDEHVSDMILGEFATKIDALDCLNDLNSMCEEGISMADVIAETYGKL